MANKYRDRELIEKRLIDTYKKYGDIIVAYDFDDTIREFPSGEPLEDVINLIKRCQRLGFTTYLWTCRSDDRLTEAITYCNRNGLYPVHINEMPGIRGASGRKPYQNILLDDKAGLDSTIQTLTAVLNIIEASEEDILNGIK